MATSRGIKKDQILNIFQRQQGLLRAWMQNYYREFRLMKDLASAYSPANKTATYALSFPIMQPHSTQPLRYCSVCMHAAAQLPFPLFRTESQVGNGPTMGRSRLNKYEQENLSQTCQQGRFSVSLVSVKLTINTNHNKGVMKLALCSSTVIL